MTRLLPTLTALLLLAAPAAAQAPSFSLAFDPARPGKAATGTLSVRDLPPESPGTAPVDTLSLALQPGFVGDAKGAPARCSAGDASEVDCPPGSRIGKGTAVLEASFAGSAPQAYTAALGVFVTAQRRAGEVAGLSLEIREPQTGTLVAVPGRVLESGGAGGLEIVFEGLSKAVPSPPPGFTVQLKSFEMTVGRKRTVTRRVRTRSGKRRKVRRTYTVLRTPRSCSGAWTGTVTIRRQDGGEAAQPLSAPCAR